MPPSRPPAVSASSRCIKLEYAHWPEEPVITQEMLDAYLVELANLPPLVDEDDSWFSPPASPLPQPPQTQVKVSVVKSPSKKRVKSKKIVPSMKPETVSLRSSARLATTKPLVTGSSMRLRARKV
jgi:hypothetical protein